MKGAAPEVAAGVPILQGRSNYFHWAKCVQTYLHYFQPSYWDAIKGRDSDRAEGATMFLVDHISHVVLLRVGIGKTAPEIWKLLEKFYGHVQVDRAVNIARDLFGLQQTGNVSSFMNQILRLADDLEACGSSESYQTLLCILMEGLNPRYGPCIAVIRTEWDKVFENNDLTSAQHEEGMIALWASAEMLLEKAEQSFAYAARSGPDMVALA